MGVTRLLRLCSLCPFYLGEHRHHPSQTQILSRERLRSSDLPTCTEGPYLWNDFILELIKLFEEKRFLDTFANHYYGQVGSTFSIFRGTQQTIFTIEPDNIKTVLAVNFKDYELGFRAPLFSPVTGRDIFAIDGDEWAHSRPAHLPGPTICNHGSTAYHGPVCAKVQVLGVGRV